MRRVIGIDIHRTFGEVVIWESGVLRHAGRVDMYSATIWMRSAELTGAGESVQVRREGKANHYFHRSRAVALVRVRLKRR